MEYFRVDHPGDRLILCNRSNREDIADYLEVNEHGLEDFVCAARTSSERYASVLPKGLPTIDPHRSRPAADLLCIHHLADRVRQEDGEGVRG